MKVLIDSSEYKLDICDVDVIYVDSNRFKALSEASDDNIIDTKVEWLYAYVVDHKIDIVFVEDKQIAIRLKELGIIVVRII